MKGLEILQTFLKSGLPKYVFIFLHNLWHFKISFYETSYELYSDIWMTVENVFIFLCGHALIVFWESRVVRNVRCEAALKLCGVSWCKPVIFPTHQSIDLEDHSSSPTPSKKVHKTLSQTMVRHSDTCLSSQLGWKHIKQNCNTVWLA
jgi:hypothetical protein